MYIQAIFSVPKQTFSFSVVSKLQKWNELKFCKKCI